MDGYVQQQRAHDPTLRYAGVGGMTYVFFHIARFQPLFDDLPCGEAAEGLDQRRVSDVIESAFDVGV